MGSSLHQWESDPLFSAAEVVQDSADRLVFGFSVFVFTILEVFSCFRKQKNCFLKRCAAWEELVFGFWFCAAKGCYVGHLGSGKLLSSISL